MRILRVFSFIFLFLVFSFVFDKESVAELFHTKASQEEALVLKVISSDTIVLEDGQRIKLLGIDSFGPPPHEKAVFDEKGRPIENKEIEPSIPLEEQAIAYAQNLMENKKVRLEYDVESRDEKGNKTAYVYLDNEMANVELLRQGFVRLKIRPPNIKYEDLLRKAYQEARKEQRGFQSY